MDQPAGTGLGTANYASKSAIGDLERQPAVLTHMQEEQPKKAKNMPLDYPDLSKLRRILFWDTDFDKIDWQEKNML